MRRKKQFKRRSFKKRSRGRYQSGRRLRSGTSSAKKKFRWNVSRGGIRL